MSEMVERSAKAAAEAAGYDFDHLSEDGYGGFNSKPFWRQTARAALQAMREPTEAMCKANWTQPISGGVDDGWRLMIDEALR